MEKELKIKMISEIQSRTQFIIVVAMFFLTVLYYFFSITDKSKADETVLSYSILVGTYILFYLIFEISKNKLFISHLKFINILTLTGVGFYLIPIFLLAMAKHLPNSWLLLYIFKFSLFGLLIIPIILVITSLFFYLFRKK